MVEDQQTDGESLIAFRILETRKREATGEDTLAKALLQGHCTGG